MRIVREGYEIYHVYIKDVDFWASRNELAAICSNIADYLKAENE